MLGTVSSISGLYDESDALALAQAVRDGHVSSRELLEEAIERLERVNPQLNAVTNRRYDAARAEAERANNKPFAGVPFLLKDLGPAIAGVPLTNGSRYFRDHVPEEDHAFVTRLKDSGLNIFAKTSAPEFGLLPYTEPVAFGPCRNPWSLERTPGGSSGGSAALVAAGVVPMAHANDMGGSIRIPASCTGVFGLKPSRGRMPVAGKAIGDANVELCVSRTVRDSAALLDAVMLERGSLYAAPHVDEPYLQKIEREPRRLRIAIVRGPMLGHSISAESRTAVDRAAALCESLGHAVEEAEPAGIDYDAVRYSLLLFFATSVAWFMHAGNPLRKPLRRGDLEPASWAMLVIAEVLSANEMTTAVDCQRRVAQAFDAFMNDYDVLLTPTLASPPVRIGELALSSKEKTQIEILARLRNGPLIRTAAREIAGRMFDWLPHTAVFNFTGQPAMSVPLHWTQDGLPVGVQFAAPYGDESTLLQLAAQLERAEPWREKRPLVWSGEAQ